MIFISIKLVKKKKKTFRNEIFTFQSESISLYRFQKRSFQRTLKKKRDIFIKIKYPWNKIRYMAIEATIRTIEFPRHKKFRSTCWRQDRTSVFVSCQLRVINYNIISLINLSQGYQVWGSSFSPRAMHPTCAYPFAVDSRR